MRPGQNKRMRGRNNGGGGGGNVRKGPNPLTRSYESNGPDVKIRGTAHHIGEKYLQLARDAQSSADPVMAESYLQHAEHYIRLIASAQQAQQQAAYGYQRVPGEQAEPEDDGDDDFGNLPDRFASPSERLTPPSAPPSYVERQPDRPPERNGYNGSDRQPYEQRGDRSYDRQPQPNAGYGDRAQADREPHGERQERPQYDNRNARHGADRSVYNREQPDRPQQDRSQPDRSHQDRSHQERPIQDRPQQERYVERGNADRPAQGDRPPRDFDNRGRGSRPPRPYRDNGEARQPVVDDQPINGLPAFITAPTRVPDVAASEPVTEAPDVPHEGEEAGFHLRPRRRRRAKAEFVGEGEAHQEPSPLPGVARD